MNIKAMFRSSFSIGLLLLIGTSTIAQTPITQVAVSGIRSEKGKVVLNIFNSKQAYENDKPDMKFEFDKKALSNGAMGLSCKLEPGTYGITLLDDENQNGSIDKNFVGIPKEGFGFSNFYMEKLRKPSFDDFKTEVKNNGAKVSIRVKYM